MTARRINTDPQDGPPVPPAAPPAPPPAMALALGASDRPLLLLPVRLETRFFAQPGGGSELRIRVYPDKVHLDSHETSLLPAERDWAQHYWTLLWKSGGDAGADGDAWRQLAGRYGDARALWLRRVQTPTNLAQRPGPLDDPATAAAALFPPVEVADAPDAGAWRRAPLARLLPDRWVAVATSGTRVLAAAAGNDIVQPLAVGPTPGAAVGADLPGDQLAIDPPMRWMVDFDAAEACGMALRLRIDSADLAAGIDRLVVLGTAAALGADEAAQRFDALLDAHRHTDGLAFARLGTPTNNTAEQRAGYAGGADPAGSLAAIGAAGLAAADEASNARRLAAVLGLPAATMAAGLATTPGAVAAHERDARSMNAALWPASWGYFLTNVIGGAGTPLTLAMLDWARERFTQHVRAQGMLPTLRCGRQPYGVLPVTSLDLWQPDGAAPSDPAPFDVLLRRLLLRLRDNVWLTPTAQVPRVGRGDPDKDLADVMRADACSNHYETRAVLGRHYLDHLRLFLGEGLVLSGFNATAESLAVGFLQRMLVNWRPRLFTSVYGDGAFPLRRELVQAGEVSAARLLEPNYVAALLDATTIDAVDRPGGQPLPAGAPLLQLLLRHGLLRAYADAAARLVASSAGGDALALMREAELVDLVPNTPPTPTWRRQLDQTVATPAGPRRVREHLQSLNDFGTPELRALGEVRAALAHLRGVDSEQLQLLMQGTLDLASHRLDAWITSFATRRLADQRAAQPQGLRVGGYGWVEKLRPRTATLYDAAPPAGEPQPLYAPAGDSGFIHAPSLTQAATAALLRNAHLGQDGRALPDGPFAIDLSSARLRDARWLLDGIRQGQPLGALLGYRLERRLHELGFDRYVAPLRELAPLNAGRLVESSLPLETIAAQNVVDGLTLWNRWHAEGAAMFAGRALPQPGPPPSPELGPLGRELDALGEAIDATGDAVTAEAAYQLVRGNTARTASTLEAVAKGEAPVPELEVARTPRTGTAITHRMVLALNGKPAAVAGWAPVGAASPRAVAEPVLNAWAAALLGDPRQVPVVVEQLDDAGAAVVATHRHTLADLQLTALAAVYAVDPDARAGTPSELERRILYHVRRSAALADGVRLRIVGGRTAGASPKALALDDVLAQAAAARRLFAVGRPLEAGDLGLPQDELDPAIDLADLDNRCVRAEDLLYGAYATLLRLLKPDAAATADALRAAMFNLLNVGITGALPVSASGDDAATRAALTAQAGALVKEGLARLERGAALRAQPAPDTPDQQRDALFERIRAVFGSGFVALAKFRCGNAAAFDAARAASSAVQGGDALAVHAWFDRVERVRDAPSRLGAALRGAEVLGTGDALRLAVAQLPPAADPAAPAARWVALPPAPGQAVPPGRLSLVLHVGGAAPKGQAMAALDTTQPICGLLVDEWVETVPNAKETTALAFQFDPPDACAPQALLLAVPPVVGQPWTVQTLHRVLTETMDLAQLRAVDAEALWEVGHYLPALHLALNHDSDAVATDFG